MSKKYETKLISCCCHEDWEQELADAFQFAHDHDYKIEFCEALKWDAKIVIVYSYEVKDERL